MTRKELYDLVWSKPMTHIGKEYGMSDQGVRKHCKINHIPTPQAGYWAKLAHGKTVYRPRLPVNKLSADHVVHLEPKPEKIRIEVPASSEIDGGVGSLLPEEPSWVPEETPKRWPDFLRELRGAFRNAAATNNGFKQLGASYNPEINVGKDSVDRCSLILLGLSRALDASGGSIQFADDKLQLILDSETFLVKIQESQAKKRHEPTKDELKTQASRDEWESRYPSDYRSSRKVYRIWDYFPSGVMSIQFRAVTGSRWNQDPIEKRWRDTKAAPLEQRISELLAWLKAAVPVVCEKRLDNERKQREHAEEVAEAERIRSRRERAKKLEVQLRELADISDARRKIKGLIADLESEDMSSVAVPAALRRELHGYTEVLRQALAEHVSSELLNSAEDEDSLISALLVQVPRVHYSWE